MNHFRKESIDPESQYGPPSRLCARFYDEHATADQLAKYDIKPHSDIIIAEKVDGRGVRYPFYCSSKNMVSFKAPSF